MKINKDRIHARSKELLEKEKATLDAVSKRCRADVSGTYQLLKDYINLTLCSQSIASTTEGINKIIEASSMHRLYTKELESLATIYLNQLILNGLSYNVARIEEQF